MDDKKKEMYDKIKAEYAEKSEKILKIIENHRDKKVTEDNKENRGEE